jgi:serine/threonine protein kinase/tetratricopeptide (TPR) repeat protein
MPFEQDHPSSHEPDVLPRGASIGRFVVLGLVGRGGMGDVYAAYDPELDRKIAVKLLRARASAGQSTSEGRTRLLREAQAIAKLSHANVVVVYDVGTFGEAVFIAMEFIDGDTVRYWLNAGPRDWREVLRVFVAAGRGLAAAHDAGLVHRDFKPDNVMVGHDGKVRVMDFGLARQSGGTDPFPVATPAAVAAELAKSGDVLEPVMPSLADGVPMPIASGTKRPTRSAPVDMDVTRVVPAPNGRKSPTQSTRVPFDGNSSGSPRALEANLTQTGAMLGTPAYMAPEQFASKPGDARTDQFSFCVALYESLYGERPFEGKSFMALMASVAKGVVREAPDGTKVPSWVRRVILRGLLPAAADRHPSMTALLDALEKDPSVAHRRWAAGAVTALMAVGMVIGAARSLQARHSPCEGGALKLAGVWEPLPATTARKQAIHSAFVATGKSYAEKTFETVKRALDKYTAAWTGTYTDACEATAVRGEQSAEVLDLRMSCLQGRLDSVKALTDLFAHADGNTVEKAASAIDGLGDLERCSDIPVLRAVVKPPDDPVTKARVEQLKPRLARVKALTDAGHISEALALARPLADEARKIGYLPLTAQAVRRLAEVSGRPAEMASLSEEAIWSAQSGGDDEVVAEDAVNLTFLTGFRLSDPKQARVWSDMADATLRRLGGHALWRAWLVNNRGAIAMAGGRYPEALTALRESVQLKEQILGKDHPDVAISLGNVGWVLAKLHRIDESLAYGERAVAIDEKALGVDHPSTAVQLSNQADLLNLAGRFSEADGLARRALAIWEREEGADHPNAAFALTTIGRSSLGLGNVRDATSTLERAYSIRRNSDPDPANLAETEFLLAQTLWSKRASRQQALSLAVEAKNHYAQAANDDAAGEVAHWLATHDSY